MNASRLLRTWGTFGILLLLFLFFAFTTPELRRRIENILVQLVPVVIAGAAVTLVMVGGSLEPVHRRDARAQRRHGRGRLSAKACPSPLAMGLGNSSRAPASA